MASQNATVPEDDSPGLLDFKLYRYTPSLPAAVVSVAVFAVLTGAHAWRIWQCRSFYFTAFAIGGLFQLVGYCGRIWSHYDETAIGGFVIQAVLILVAPALYAASIYMVLGRLVQTLRAAHLSLVPVAWMTKLFVSGDIVSFTMQAGGGGIQAVGTLDLYEIGEKIIIVGLFVQIAIFGFFIVTGIVFHRRFAKEARATQVPWKRHLTVLYSTSGIILVRSIFRVVEYLQGNGGYLISHEIFLYIFDTVLMAVVMGIFALWYIGDLDPRHRHKQQESEDLEGQEAASGTRSGANRQADMELASRH